MKRRSTLPFLSRISLLLLVAVLFNQNLMAQKPMAKKSFEISLEADEKINSEIKSNMRVDLRTGLPVALYGLNYSVPAGTPESMALYYLEHESKKLGIPRAELSNLRHHATRTTNSGSVVRYRQYHEGYPVNKAEVTISISKQNKVVYVMNSYQVFKPMGNIQASVSKETAYNTAYNYLGVAGDVAYKANRVMIYNNYKMTRLAHEVTILTNSPRGEWHVLVDAQTQEIFKVVDVTQHYCSNDNKTDVDCNHQDDAKNERRRRVNGTGMVFNPDPLSSNLVAYGGGYVDGGDADTAELTAARFSVTLRDITNTGGVYSLVGPRAEITDWDAPNTGLFTQNSPDFNFTRNEQGFEAVNIYYHIDYLMGYINDDLGCVVLPYQYSGGVQYDPHGWGGDDQSSYSPGTGRLTFGEGCVDDGEDSDVIHHELGHGLHDWVTAGNNSGAEGLGEGTGDYVAQSYNRGLGNWDPSDPAYNYVFNWDGHNECWNGRVTNYGATYPGGLTGSIHTDGQIWASCLMGIWDEIGQEKMDKIFWEGLGMTAGTTGQNDAAVAVYQAAVNLSYTTSEINTIHSKLSDCGYTLPALPGPPVAALSADKEAICLDTNNVVNFMDETVPDATSWMWTFEGGTPATSIEENPTVTYAATGTYNVTLEVTNSYGTDSVTMTDYISVVSGAACPSCTTFNSGADLNIGIPDGAGGNGVPGAPATSVINIPASLTIDYITVSVDIAHAYINDVIVELIHPNGTTAVAIFDRECGADDDIVVNFADGLPAFNCGATTGDYAPSNPLSPFSGLDSAGDWTLSVTDNWDGITGAINAWSIEVCTEPTASIAENTFDVFSIYPNPNKGEFTVSLNSSSNKDINVDVYDIRGRSILNNTYSSASNFNQAINLNNVQSGMYLVKVSDGERQTIKKIIVE